MSLSLPTDAGGGAGREVGTSTSPRRAVSPLLEIRRPHCTLNCDYCNAFLEDRYRQMSMLNMQKYFFVFFFCFSFEMICDFFALHVLFNHFSG